MCGGGRGRGGGFGGVEGVWLNGVVGGEVSDEYDAWLAEMGTRGEGLDWRKLARLAVVGREDVLA